MNEIRWRACPEFVLPGWTVVLSEGLKTLSESRADPKCCSHQSSERSADSCAAALHWQPIKSRTGLTRNLQKSYSDLHGPRFILPGGARSTLSSQWISKGSILTVEWVAEPSALRPPAVQSVAHYYLTALCIRWRSKVQSSLEVSKTTQCSEHSSGVNWVVLDQPVAAERYWLNVVTLPCLRDSCSNVELVQDYYYTFFNILI